MTVTELDAQAVTANPDAFAWGKIMATLAGALAAENEYICTTWRDADVANVKHGIPIPDEVESSLCELSDAAMNARRTMLSTPAPDLPALAQKLRRLLSVEPAVNATNIWDGNEVLPVLADIDRLMGAKGQRVDAKPAPAIDIDKQDDGHRLYSAWRHAKAQWDLFDYAPDNTNDRPADKVSDGLSRAAFKALDAYLTHPAANLANLALKLKVFKDEEIWDGWHLAEEVSAVIAADAHRLAFGD
ncbi:MAG: hypothetical protein P4M15_06100 [Alphaproteobacteria bacterium]|nr:hypothetical protein [Alphaproteobacteria bacterium]